MRAYLEAANVSTKLMQTSIGARRYFRREIWWWHICGVINFLGFISNWGSESMDYFVWRGRLMLIFSCYLYKIIGTFLEPSICLIYSSTIQIIRSCRTTSEWVLLQVTDAWDELGTFWTINFRIDWNLTKQNFLLYFAKFCITELLPNQ